MKKNDWDEAIMASDLSTSEKMVALAVSSRGDYESGTKHAQAVSTIAQKASLSERQAHRVLASLVKEGWLLPDFRPGKTTSYTLSTPDTHDTPAPDCTPVTSVTPVMDDTPTPVMGDTPPLTPMTPYTIDTTTRDTIEELEPQAPPTAGSSSDDSSLKENEMKDELEQHLDEYEREARLLPGYSPNYWQEVRAVAREHYNSGTYPLKAIGLAFEGVAA